MGDAAVGENPFQPGAGARPPVLAGRDAELALANKLLSALERGAKPSRGILFFGPRGNGKTVLLARIADEARGRGMRAERLPASAFRSPEALRRDMQENAGVVGTRLTAAQAAGFGISTEPGPPTRNVAKLLADWIRTVPSPLVILLDEAHTIEPEAGGIFFDAVQDATDRSLPFLLLAAGTPDAPRRLRQAGTFTERALRRVPIGRLERPDTLRALTEPARSTGLPMRGDAAAFLARASDDYPYFVQLLGSAAWEAAEEAGDPEVNLDSARRGSASARPEIERFHAERFGEAREREVEGALAPLAALFPERGGRLRDAELRELLRAIAARESIPTDRGQLLSTLSDLGVLWEIPPAGWELGIPSFGDFLLKHHAADTGAH